MTDLFPPRPAPRLPIAGDSRVFPVNRIFCIGRNYADHAAEMGAAPEPIFFMKPAHSIITGSSVPYPPQTSDLHHEVEMVLALGPGAEIVAAGTGVDLTRRDLQGQMKDKRAPWEIGKAFTASAPVGALRLGPAPSDGAISLSVNGDNRQSGDLNQMILPPAELITALSRYFDLAEGDLIFSGTPAGVAAISPGDTVAARIARLPDLDFTLTGA
jgi:fumarylpyruvate hydrolase